MQTPQPPASDRRDRIAHLIALVTRRLQGASDAELAALEQRLSARGKPGDALGPLLDRAPGSVGRNFVGGGIGRVLQGKDREAMLERLTVDSGSTDWARSPLKGAGEVADALEVARSTIDNWRRARRVIAFEKGVRNFVFPMAQFDGAKPVPGLAAVAMQFDDVGDAWEWLVSPNRMTGDAPPLGWLRAGRTEDVVAAARGRFDFA